jgi:hypothetical protein
MTDTTLRLELRFSTVIIFLLRVLRHKSHTSVNIYYTMIAVKTKGCLNANL